MDSGMGGGRRFNLLLLKHHEVLFDSAAAVDVSVEFVNGGDASSSGDSSGAVRQQQPRHDGRLWICSQCLVFEPKDYSRPLERLDFEKMAQAPALGGLVTTRANCSLGSPMSGDEQQVILLEVSQRVEMKRFGKSEPYVLCKEHSRRIFLLQHRSVERTLALVERLWSVRQQLLKEPRLAHAGLEVKLLGPLTETRLAQPFDKSRLHDFREVLLTPKEIRVSLVSQMTNIPGCIMLTDQRLYFQPAQLNNIGEVVQSFPLGRLCGVYKRRYLLRQRALEVRFECRDTDLFAGGVVGAATSPGGGRRAPLPVALLLIFEDGTHIRELVFNLLEGYMTSNSARETAAVATSPNTGPLPLINRSTNLGIGDNNPYSMRQKLEMLRMAWQDREISNFEYLMYLNTLADRSISDLTQYPVFPWVLQDYTSDTLDLSNPDVFRDLSKPIGALNATRLASFKERFQHMQVDATAIAGIGEDNHNDGGNGMPSIPPFLYGTHYTTPGYVLYYLVRKNPDLMLRLQNGQFDRPDRCFHSIASTWDSVLNNTADLKELIPEFYDSDGEFLVNLNQLDLGRRQDGTFVDDVVLPPWASTPRDFVEKCRAALESDHVSAHLHEWIDLIFGYQQRGTAAVEADNLFYYLTYEGTVDLDKVEDPSERKSFEAQIIEFGQTPRQLFFKPHPGRNDIAEEEFTDDDSSYYEGNELTISSEAVDDVLEACAGGEDGKDKTDATYASKSSPRASDVKSSRVSSPVVSQRAHDPAVAAQPSPPNSTELVSPHLPSFARSPVTSFANGDKDNDRNWQIPSGSNSSWWNRVDGTIQRYEAVTDIKAHRGPVSDICTSKVCPNTVYSVSLDGSLSQVSLAERAIKRRMAVGKLALGCCAESRDGAVVVGSWDNSLYACSLKYGRMVRRIVAHEDAVCKVSTNASSKILATGSWESSLKIWNVSSSHSAASSGSLSPSGTCPSTTTPQMPSMVIQPSATFYEHGSMITGIEVDSMGHMVVSASAAGDILLHDLRVGDVVQHFTGCLERGTHAVSVHWTHNETAILACGRDGLVDVYDVSAGGRRGPAGTVDSLLPPGSRVCAAAVTPDRLNVVIGTACGRLSLCNANLLRNLSARSASRSIWKPSSASAASAKLRKKRALGVEYAYADAAGSGFAAGLGAASSSSNVPGDVSELCVSSLACINGAGKGAEDLILMGQCSGTIKLLKRLQ